MRAGSEDVRKSGLRAQLITRIHEQESEELAGSKQGREYCAVYVRWGDENIYSSSETHPALADFNVSQNTRSSYLFQTGWALRPNRGERMGLNTVPKYNVDLTAFYASGAREKERRMSAAQMREALF